MPSDTPATPVGTPLEKSRLLGEGREEKEGSSDQQHATSDAQHSSDEQHAGGATSDGFGVFGDAALTSPLVQPRRAASAVPRAAVFRANVFSHYMPVYEMANVQQPAAARRARRSEGGGAVAAAAGQRDGLLVRRATPITWSNTTTSKAGAQRRRSIAAISMTLSTFQPPYDQPS
mmetsp:Transcript_3434/g.8529  ORF Transcript_3434/g.8529 Transcript_3434/m.8529 type:complete len:175 (+) Transcript_3434:46-570(+)